MKKSQSEELRRIFDDYHGIAYPLHLIEKFIDNEFEPKGPKVSDGQRIKGHIWAFIDYLDRYIAKTGHNNLKRQDFVDLARECLGIYLSDRGEDFTILKGPESNVFKLTDDEKRDIAQIIQQICHSESKCQLDLINYVENIKRPTPPKCPPNEYTTSDYVRIRNKSKNPITIDFDKNILTIKSSEPAGSGPDCEYLHPENVVFKKVPVCKNCDSTFAKGSNGVLYCPNCEF